ncbi:molybdenum cofactor biosynthesis protein MoaE [Boudabousia liubingyangii]|uniref:Molybdenum cofactor biosynthesis protein MoaE n=1 Tax=Boudabousia liubingyangii TaxID=1921764 RepID=A0A1Q5PQE7_9ACTO|nr:molybdenum cofactor biosynthesis protein MoaE [Boudabousia liubingyangii]OKL49630.1 molybdenum cofactor biosynthesis protein MoaE [Boudabousia liubingyangii]
MENPQTAPSKVRNAQILDTPLDLEAALVAVEDPAAGAVVSFVGQVRNHDHGAQVTHLDYSSHPVAQETIEEIANEVAARPDITALWVAHRVGNLQIGDAALVATVSAPHRGPAFEALSDLVEEVKKRLQIWKCQYFPDGTHEWSNCP